MLNFFAAQLSRRRLPAPPEPAKPVHPLSLLAQQDTSRPHEPALAPSFVAPKPRHSPGDHPLSLLTLPPGIWALGIGRHLDTPAILAMRDVSPAACHLIDETQKGKLWGQAALRHLAKILLIGLEHGSLYPVVHDRADDAIAIDVHSRRNMKAAYKSKRQASATELRESLAENPMAAAAGGFPTLAQIVCEQKVMSRLKAYKPRVIPKLIDKEKLQSEFARILDGATSLDLDLRLFADSFLSSQILVQRRIIGGPNQGTTYEVREHQGEESTAQAGLISRQHMLT
jgi:hypothetical protein